MKNGVKIEENPKFFHGGSINRRIMENGDVLSRFQPDAETLILCTLMHKYDPAESSLPWQEPYLRRGFVESYTLVSGWAHFVYGTYPKHRRLATVGESLTFQPETPRVVVFGPGAKIVVSCVGTPVPNPERDNEDWWPADNAFAVIATQEQFKVEEEFELA